MKTLSLFTLCALLFSCGSIKEDINMTSNANEPVVATLGDATLKSDPLTITSALINGNIMTIEIEYSGGCEEHILDLKGSFSVMKSRPAKRSIKLMHNANGDSCRKMVNQTLHFDISSFAMSKTSGSEIILLLDGFKEEISYIYP